MSAKSTALGSEKGPASARGTSRTGRDENAIGPRVLHDPAQFAADVAAQQAASERRVRLFVGAGASAAAGLPDLTELGRVVRATVRPSREAIVDGLFKDRDLEAVLTRIRRIIALLAADESFAGLTLEDASHLELAVTASIVETIANARPTSNPYDGVASWLGRQRRHEPVEVFSLNYDLLLEHALDDAAVPVFDGFVGLTKAAFRADLVDAMSREDRLPAFVARIWKLHGSVNWMVEKRGETRHIVRLGGPTSENVAAIYPSEEKYEASRRSPFVVLHDRLRRALDEPESVTLIAGYSFRDQHLNEVIFDAIRRNPRSSIVAFCHSGLPDSAAQVASANGNFALAGELEAIWGTKKGTWGGDPIPGVFEDGKFVLGSFPRLAAVLARDAGGSIA
jgi:hypothetical protein